MKWKKKLQGYKPSIGEWPEILIWDEAYRQTDTPDKIIWVKKTYKRKW